MDKSTAIVIGAGASMEAGLPSGEQLKAVISKNLAISIENKKQNGGNKLIYEALVEHLNPDKYGSLEFEEYIRLGRFISTNLPLANSIDSYIYSQSDNRISFIGKLAIAVSILNAEKNCKLYINSDTHSNHSFSLLSDTWYIKFFRWLVSSKRLEELESRLNNLTLVIFNYDRCLEYFLINTIARYYEINLSDATNLVRKINIFHPYGVVGDLPQLTNEGIAVPFGGVPDSQKLISLTKSLKTYTEGINDKAEVTIRLRTKLSSIDRLIFLGFSYNNDNMKFLPATNVSHTLPSNTFGTIYGISDEDKGKIVEKINNAYGKNLNPNLTKSTCTDFFDLYQHNLVD